jgi:hypothetical protein
MMRCPEPKPVFIFIMGICGAMGMIGERLITENTWETGGWIGFGMGTACGVSMALHSKRWIRLAAVPAISFGSILASLQFARLVHEGGMMGLDVIDATCGMLVQSTMMVCALVLTHELFLAAFPQHAIEYYIGVAIIGAVSYWVGMDSKSFRPLFAALVFILIQGLGMVSARAFDAKLRSAIPSLDA